MSTIPIDLSPFRSHLDSKPTADILERCLACNPELPERSSLAVAIPFDPRSRKIERLKMSQPRAAATQATAWLEEALQAAIDQPQNAEAVGLFCSALSTWGGLQRNLGQLGDAALATHHALSILLPQPVSTRAGFALHRAAFLLGDLGDLEGGLTAAQQAVAIHDATPGGRHNVGRHNVGIALAGLGAFQLFYRRSFAEARAAFTMALHALPNDDQIMLVGASHGVAYSYLMEERFDDARESLTALRQLVPVLDEDQELRLGWLAAEIEVASGRPQRALEIYSDVFGRSLATCEETGPLLVAFDVARVLLELNLEPDDGQWRRWHERIRPIVEELTPSEVAAIEPFLDAFAAGDLERELLDQTTVAFKKASNRMLLGMGRPGAAVRPESFPQQVAA